MLNPYGYLSFNARAWPDRLALVDDHNALTHARLDTLARQAATRLAEAGVRPGSLVVTCLPPGLDWIITLALLHEACVTCSKPGVRPLPPVVEADWIVVLEEQSWFPRERQIVLDAAWQAALPAAVPAPEPRAYPGDDALCRLILTSGTTGHARAIAYSVARLIARLRGTAQYWSVARGELNLMPLSTIGGFMTALSNAFTGDAWIPPGTPGLVQRARRLGVRALAGSPQQLAVFLRRVVASGEELPVLREIRSAGGTLSPALAAALRDRFNQAEIINVYGSTEAGGIAACAWGEEVEATLAGYVLPGVEVRVVDADGRPLPAGEEGLLRVRGSGMAEGYYRDPVATAEQFREGWFQPGDRGRLLPDGRLLLGGRDSEVINRGGVKVDPEHVDQLLRAWPALEDAAAFAVDDGSGVTELAMALVAPADIDVKALYEALLAGLGRARLPRYHVFVDAVPRNELGKVRRGELGQQLAEVLRQQRAAGMP